MEAEIAVMWIGEAAEPVELLEEVAGHLSAAFAARARVVRTPERPAGVFDARRRQHASTGILGWLQQRPLFSPRLLAVTDVDLFIPVLTFVFGEAQLGGRFAVVSMARLRDARAPRLTATRKAKEAVHEVGHLFSLVHCLAPSCAMRRSAALSDVDAKGSRLCPDCRILLREAGRTRVAMEAL